MGKKKIVGWKRGDQFSRGGMLYAAQRDYGGGRSVKEMTTATSKLNPALRRTFI